ncbi:hypothetical protein IVB43_23820 [Bradyrhizobium sp. 48]|uniref:hypothetical protein n=1 Tax=Bradyrhizobium sp. 48 TaxID=2782676 RepID=UPI001FF908A7|nr:hypothetical protein [Bradyrhizobium sp. 48]MCK1445417.1 hypothetical protein [Bradyrhizobium sp. 48]
MSDGEQSQFELVAGTEVCEFVLSDREVDIIQGPLGSGKTRALCARVMRHAQQQRVSKITGLRMSRWFLARNTYPDLKTTTIRTWLEMFPEHIYGRFNWGQPPAHKIRFGDVSLDIDFLALDKPEDVRKLRSTEYTGGGFNEIPFIDKEIFDEGTSRLRYPGASHGGSAWHGIIADANAPDEDHWLAIMTGQVDFPPNLTEDEKASYRWPEHWGFYKQPPAVLEVRDTHNTITGYEVNQDAENLHNLPPGYYAKQLFGKKKAWIDSRLRNVVALVVEGSPVYPEFVVDVHVSRDALRPIPGVQLTVGLDFGRQPAAIFMQAANNRVYVQYELLGHNESSVTFAPKVKRFIAEKYPEWELSQVRFYGDPKGQDKGQQSERTSYEIFEANGMVVRPPPGLRQNDITTRVSAVTSVHLEMSDGKPRYVLSPLCRTLKVAKAGRYHLIKEDDGVLRPKKDRYSNPADAEQYGILGLGEGDKMVGRRPVGEARAVRAYSGRKTMRRIAG